MEKLWPFIEERGVVLVAFENEFRPVAELKGAAKVFRNSAD